MDPITYPAIVEVQQSPAAEPLTTWAAAALITPPGPHTAATLAWIEPHYIDPLMTRPAAHAFSGTLDGSTLTTDSATYTLRAPTPDERAAADAASQAWADWTRSHDVTPEAERQILIDHLTDMTP